MRLRDPEQVSTRTVSTDQANENWTPWVVTDGYSGFEVDDPLGRASAAQVDLDHFVLTTGVRFVDEPTIAAYRRRLIESGSSSAQATEMVDRARHLGPGEVATDLASVPRFMGWFEAPYGRHTLAAVLHDELIKSTPNRGALGSDTLSDSFFRDMLGVAGVPFFKRWLMWAAVAARTRLGGQRSPSRLAGPLGPNRPAGYCDGWMDRGRTRRRRWSMGSTRPLGHWSSPAALRGRRALGPTIRCEHRRRSSRDLAHPSSRLRVGRIGVLPRFRTRSCTPFSHLGRLPGPLTAGLEASRDTTYCRITSETIDRL